MKIRAYARPDGSFGIRNKILVLSTVGCANETAAAIAKNVTGAVCIPNTKGCGQIGASVPIMRRTLCGLARNPNVYGTLVVGLGCETVQPESLCAEIRALTNKPLACLTIQEAGGTVRAIERGVRIAAELAREASLLERVETDLAEITLATNCGGSDATSGIAANPALGYCSDRLVDAGGSVFIGETTELIGTEHLLAGRAMNDAVRDAILRVVQGLENDFKRLGIDVRGANPTPGNMKGGLSTLEEKALGGISKGGTSTIREVVPYGCRPTQKGLLIMDTPGYDIESVTGMAAGSAQVCVFTTGRGTPIGNPLLPVIKITGNADTYQNMADNIDLDLSGVLTGGQSIADAGEAVFSYLIEVLNGAIPKAESYGFGEASVYRNFEIWCNHI